MSLTGVALHGDVGVAVPHPLDESIGQLLGARGELRPARLHPVQAS
jgi:hypothetical protein